MEFGGAIDPENIDEYIAVGGYESLKKVLSGSKPDEIIAEIIKSGLRGKGGGGFVTGHKWKKAANAPSYDGARYILVNGDEGNPASYMDRSVMEGNPHQMLEGLIIGACALVAADLRFKPTATV